MTRRPAHTPEQSELREYLLDTFKEEARRQPHRRRVDTHIVALTDGHAVDIQVADLPAWAREKQVLHWWRRATISATGLVNFYDDLDGRWLEDHGL